VPRPARSAKATRGSDEGASIGNPGGRSAKATIGIQFVDIGVSDLARKVFATDQVRHRGKQRADRHAGLPLTTAGLDDKVAANKYAADRRIGRSGGSGRRLERGRRAAGTAERNGLLSRRAGGLNAVSVPGTGQDQRAGPPEQRARGRQPARAPAPGRRGRG